MLFSPETTVPEKAGQTAADLADVGQDLGGKVVGAGEQTWDTLRAQFTEIVSVYLPKAAAALVVLIVGWLIALVVAAVARGVARRLGRTRWFGKWVSAEEGREIADVSHTVGRAVFYLFMLFVLVAFFQTLGLTAVTEPLTAFLNQVFEYAPRLVAAAVILFIAWVVAKILRFAVRSALSAAKVDRRLTRQTGVDSVDDVPLTNTLSEATYWLTFLFFLPAVLDALAVPGMLSPVQQMVTQVLGFLPNLFAAAVILAIGWFVARIAQRFAANLLDALGIDRLSERVGLATIMGGNRLSAVLGLVVYVLVFVPVIIASLNALKIEAITRPASDMLDTMLGTIPGIISAVFVVGVAWVVGHVVSGIVTNLLTAIGFDRLPFHLGLASATPHGGRSPSQIAGYIVMVAIVLFAIMQALPMLGFNLLASMMSEFLVFATQVFLGLVIFGFGLYFARLVGDIIRDSAIDNALLLSRIARVAIIAVAGAMGLQQTGLAAEIVNIAFGITAGAIAVAAAVAFGIGGREAAKTMIDDFVKARGHKAKG
jgi:Mechanosensitive ion channel, conserved TM helix